MKKIARISREGEEDEDDEDESDYEGDIQNIFTLELFLEVSRCIWYSNWDLFRHS